MRYITPTSYLQLIQNFKSLLSEQTKRIRTLQQRYGNGLKQLEETGENVKKMKQTLIELQPVLVQATKDTEEMIVKVNKESIEAEAMAQEVAKEEEMYLNMIVKSTHKSNYNLTITRVNIQKKIREILG